MSMTPWRRFMSSRGQNVHLALQMFVASICTISGIRGARSRPARSRRRRSGFALRVSNDSAARRARWRMGEAKAQCVRWYSMTSRRISSSDTRGSYPMSARIFARSGTRRGMSSKPLSYAWSYGMCTIGEELFVSAFTRSARPRIDISSVLPTL